MKRRVAATAVALLLTAGLATPAAATPGLGPWLDRTASPLDTVDPAASLDDLAPLRRSVGDATIVALGEPAHEVAEVTMLKHRTLRYLVERMGFRALAFEDDWTLGLRIDEFVRTGEGDIDALLRQTGGGWATRETADMLTWLRDFNSGRPVRDQVRFVGVEYYTTWWPAYEIVDSYVADVAPWRHAELRTHLDALEPAEDTETAFQHARRYMAVADKQPYVDHARAVFDLVSDVAPHRSTARHAARQILSFHVNYHLSWADAVNYRDARAAENLRWVRETSRDKIVYWAASPHTAPAPNLRIVAPPEPDMLLASAGSHLKRWYGNDYRSIGFTFDHGTLTGDAITVPPPAPNWFERPFGAVDADQFLLDLRGPVPGPVRDWLRAPATTRGFVEHVPAYESYMTGGTLAQWFDVIVHRQTVTQAAPL